MQSRLPVRRSPSAGKVDRQSNEFAGTASEVTLLHWEIER